MRRQTLIACLLLYAAFTAYGCLAPFAFHADAGDVRARFQRALQFWPVGDRIAPSKTDLLSNVLLYVPFGLLVALASPGSGAQRAFGALVLAVLAGGGVSLAIEALQLLTPTRISGAHDVLANTLGSLLGGFLGLLLGRPTLRFLHRLDTHRRGIILATFLYLLLLLADGWYPFLPTLDVSQVVGNLRNSRFALPAALAEHSLDHWLIWRVGAYGLLTAMLAACIGPQDGRWKTALLVTLGLAIGTELAKPFIQGRRFNLANPLLSAVGALAVAAFGARLDRRTSPEQPRSPRLRRAGLWLALCLAGLSLLLRGLLRSEQQYDTLGLFAPRAPGLGAVMLALGVLMPCLAAAFLARLNRTSFRLGLLGGAFALAIAGLVWLVLLASLQAPPGTLRFVLPLAGGLLLVAWGQTLLAEWFAFGASPAWKIAGLLAIPLLAWVGLFLLLGVAFLDVPLPGLRWGGALPAGLLCILLGAAAALLVSAWPAGGALRTSALLGVLLLGLPGWGLGQMALAGGTSRLTDSLLGRLASDARPGSLSDLARWGLLQFAAVVLLAIGRAITKSALPELTARPAGDPSRGARPVRAGMLLAALLLSASLLVPPAIAEPPLQTAPTTLPADPRARKRALDLRARARLAQARREFPGYHTVLDNPNRLLYVSAVDPKRLAAAQSLLSRYAAVLRKRLFTHEPAWTITVLLPSVRDYHRLVGRPGVYGVYSPPRRTLLSLSFSSVLLHEYTHALHHVEQASLGQQHPIWLIEGLAMLLQHSRFEQGRLAFRGSAGLEHLQDALRDGSGPSLADLARLDPPGFMKDPDLHYAHTHYLLLWLQRLGRLDAFYRRYVQSYEADPTGIEALQETLGKDRDALEADFRNWLAAQKPPWRPAREAKAYLGLRMRQCPEGVEITGFARNAPAGQSGILKVGDLLVSIAGEPVESVRDVTSAVRTARPGQTVTIELLRRGKPLTVHQLLGAFPGRRR